MRDLNRQANRAFCKRQGAKFETRQTGALSGETVFLIALFSSLAVLGLTLAFSGHTTLSLIATGLSLAVFVLIEIRSA
jgi:hypothetical protein